MIQYPDYLPIPLRDSFGFQAVSPMVRSDLQSGRARQRRRFTSVPTVASLQWLMTDLQARMFEAWWEEVLVSGTEWFEMPLKTPLGGLQLYACRFTDIYRGPVLVGVSLWRFTAELELLERPILPPGWIVIAPEFIRYADILDRALNQEWPQA